MSEPVIELELYLVRHGQSRANAGLGDTGNIRRREDPRLSEKGETQARLLGEFYARMEFDCILASGLDRAMQTAGAVALRQKRARLVEAHPIFTECGVPTAYGKKTLAELEARFPYVLPAPGTDPAESYVFTQDRPSDDERYARAAAAVRYLRARFRAGEKVLVASHANFSTFFLFAALGLGAENGFDVAFSNTGVSKFIFYAPGTGRWDEDTHLIWHNNCAHLAEAFPEDILTAN